VVWRVQLIGMKKTKGAQKRALIVI